MTPDSENDFGNYNCTAVNRIGQESSEFILVQAGEHPRQGDKKMLFSSGCPFLLKEIFDIGENTLSL